MQEETCKKCGEIVVGEDYGDHEAYITFYCDCGNSWSKDITGELIDKARQFIFWRSEK